MFPLQNDTNMNLAPETTTLPPKDYTPQTIALETDTSSAAPILVTRMQENVLAKLQALLAEPQALQARNSAKGNPIGEVPKPPSDRAPSTIVLSNPIVARMQEQILADLQAQQATSSESESSQQRDDDAYIYTYTDLDVFMGQGGMARYHPGNKWYLAAKTRLQEEYFSAQTSEEKLKISQQLIETVYARGGRFLEKLSEGTFVEVGRKRAETKARQALREVAKHQGGDLRMHTPEQVVSVRIVTAGAHEAPTRQKDRASRTNGSDMDENTANPIIMGMQERVIANLATMVKADSAVKCNPAVVDPTPPTIVFSAVDYKENPIVSKMQEQILANLQAHQTASVSESSEQQDDVDHINTYTDLDVFMGRGGMARHHPGNKWYLAAKTRLQEDYFSARTIEEKTKISHQLVDTVYARGGRFIEKVSSTGTFVEVGRKRVRIKASQALREVAKRLQK
jgi:DNA-binding SARP family transcriptional activator